MRYYTIIDFTWMDGRVVQLSYLLLQLHHPIFLHAFPWDISMVEVYFVQEVSRL